MHNDELCIGCRKCQSACPYSNRTLGEESLNGEDYSVISFNRPDADTQPPWTDKSAHIPGVTGSGAETAQRAGAMPPTLNRWQAGDVELVRRSEVVEKCTFCYHRTSQGLQPACVEVCPSKARIFGDQDDPKSEIASVLKAQKSFRLQEDKGTKPNVHYVGKYGVRA
jgi:Fe-S-cluster-containing dehydrogenase component